MEDPVLFTVQDRVGTLTFNRPKSLNAMDLTMSRRLGAFATELPARTDLDVLVLRGAGQAFMAGGDVPSFAGPTNQVVDLLEELISPFHAFVLAIHKSPLPIVAAVHGAAAGAGFSIAIGADITIAADNAKFIPAYRKLGTTPDGGGTFFLNQLLGPKRGMEILLASDAISAPQALSLGLINQIVPAAELDAGIERLVGTLSANARAATTRTKALLRGETIGLLEEHLRREKLSFIECAKTKDFAEGVAAFLEKRAPRFGRASVPGETQVGFNQ